MSLSLKPRIAWALGGGGVRGLAHLGVLEVMQEEGIPIDFLAGTSMGAAVAVAYAAGEDLKSLVRLAESIPWERLFDLRFPRMGLFSGDRIMSVLRLLTKNKRLEELNPPVRVVATDLYSGREVILKEGPIEPAVRASIAIPGVFTPVRYGEMLLVDGGVVAGVPVEAAKGMGADLVIAVRVSYDFTLTPPKNILEIMMKSTEIMGNRLDGIQVEKADLVITPEVGSVGTGHFTKAADCINKGRIAAREGLPEIRRLFDWYSSYIGRTEEVYYH